MGCTWSDWVRQFIPNLVSKSWETVEYRPNLFRLWRICPYRYVASFLVYLLYIYIFPFFLCWRVHVSSSISCAQCRDWAVDGPPSRISAVTIAAGTLNSVTRPAATHTSGQHGKTRASNINTTYTTTPHSSLNEATRISRKTTLQPKSQKQSQHIQCLQHPFLKTINCVPVTC